MLVDVVWIGVVGFCFGGIMVLEMVCVGVLLVGVVSLYGGLGLLLFVKVGGMYFLVLVFNGVDDKGVSKDDIVSFE